VCSSYGVLWIVLWPIHSPVDQLQPPLNHHDFCWHSMEFGDGIMKPAIADPPIKRTVNFSISSFLYHIHLQVLNTVDGHPFRQINMK
jgi:hypothetical protein